MHFQVNSFCTSLLTASAGASSNSAALGLSLFAPQNLPVDADKLFLYEKFSPYGAILSVKVLNDPQSGQCRGVGFVVSWTTACCFCSMCTWYTRQSVSACAQYLLAHWSVHAWLVRVRPGSDCAGASCAHGFLCVCTVLA